MATQRNRGSKGYQNNQVKKVLKDLDVEDIDLSKVKKTGISIAIASVLCIGVLGYFFKWAGILVAVILTSIVLYFFYKNILEQQKKMVLAYKTLGITKEEYIKSLEELKTNQQMINILINAWDKVPQPEKIIQQKGRAQGVNQSKQNKKKRKYKK